MIKIDKGQVNVAFDDMREVEGDFCIHAVTLHEQFGYTKEALQEMINEVIDAFDENPEFFAGKIIEDSDEVKLFGSD